MHVKRYHLLPETGYSLLLQVLYWEETYPADNCNYYPFYKHEFFQAIYLNFTYIMDLAPVGTT